MNNLIHIKELYKKIRQEKLREVIISSPDEWEVLWNEMSAWYGGLPLVRKDLEEQGVEHFLCRGIPVILKESLPDETKT